MVKWFKLPGIQVCIEFDVFFPGSLRGQNRVVSRWKNSIFTIDKSVKSPRENTLRERYSHLWGVLWITVRGTGIKVKLPSRRCGLTAANDKRRS
jgi:hypothetical protein